MKMLIGALIGAAVGLVGMMIYSPNEHHPWMAIPILIMAVLGAAIAR